MALSLVTGPSVEPLSLIEAKELLRVEHDDENALISRLIQAARENVQTATRRQLINATWRLTLDAFPSSEQIELPRPPLSSVTSVQYVDTDIATQTLSSDNYSVDTYSEPGRIKLIPGESWPSTGDRPNAVTVTFVAGYGAAGSNVPETLRLALAQLISHWYEHREAVATGNVGNEVKLAVESLLAMNGWGSYV